MEKRATNSRPPCRRGHVSSTEAFGSEGPLSRFAAAKSSNKCRTFRASWCRPFFFPRWSKRPALAADCMFCVAESSGMVLQGAFGVDTLDQDMIHLIMRDPALWQGCLRVADHPHSTLTASLVDRSRV